MARIETRFTLGLWGTPSQWYADQWAEALDDVRRHYMNVVSQVGGSQLVNVRIDGADDPEFALLRDVQRDVITGDLLHVDFYRVMMTETITTEVPLLTTGESSVVVQKDGILLLGISEVEVECLPGDLVDALCLDRIALIEIAGQMVVVAGGRKGSGDREQHDLLAAEDLGRRFFDDTIRRHHAELGVGQAFADRDRHGSLHRWGKSERRWQPSTALAEGGGTTKARRALRHWH